MRLTANGQSRIVIVGGGSSGWMTAAYLSKAFGPRLAIQVIESPRIKTIGVGEATFSDVHAFFDFLGLAEDDWMAACNASYKIAIKFVGWRSDGAVFYHPFERPDAVGGRTLLDWWLKGRQAQPFDRECYASTRVCDACRSPRFTNGVDYAGGQRPGPSLAQRIDSPSLLEDLQGQYPYGYHLDAALFARVLQQYATARGVTTRHDDVVDVMLSDTGEIAALRMRDGSIVEGDLFVDCSGFRDLLLQQALKEPFISFFDSLPCDRAVAMQVPSDPAVAAIEPYTTATALDAGWVWNIPLFHRVGTGYVYSSAYASPDQAETALRRHIGARANGCDASHIAIRVGRHRHAWVKNCVAIGLAGGFVEPLESTGLFFVQYAIEQLATHLHEGSDPHVIANYNRAVGDCIDGVREFLTLHYVASSRADTPFWQATTHDLALPGELAERLQLWRRQLPSRSSIFPRYHGFGWHNYAAMLLGLGWHPTAPRPVVDAMDDGKATARFAAVARRGRFLARALPPLNAYLAEKYRGRDAKSAAGELAQTVM